MALTRLHLSGVTVDRPSGRRGPGLLCPSGGDSIGAVCSEVLVGEFSGQVFGQQSPRRSIEGFVDDAEVCPATALFADGQARVDELFHVV